MRITLDEKQAKIVSIALACFIADIKSNQLELEVKDEDWFAKWFGVAEKWDAVDEEDSAHISTCIDVLKKLNKEIK